MKTLRAFALLLLICIALTGCSHFSRTSRQQRAYEKYIRKSSIARVRQSVKLRTNNSVQLPPMPQMSEPIVSASAGPESVSVGSE